MNHPHPRAAEVLAADDARLQAMRGADLAALDGLLADALVYTHSAGRRETKSQFLAGLAEGRVKYLECARSDTTASVYQGACVMSGTLGLKVTIDGQPKSFSTLFQSVWVPDSGRWQMAAWASTLPPST